MKLVYSTVLFLIAILAVSGYQLSLSQLPENTAAPDKPGRIKIQDMHLYTSIEDAQQEALRENKPLFIYAHSETCGWCKKFESEAFKDERVTSFLDANFVAADLNIHAQRHLSARYAVRGTPTMIFLSPAGEEIARINGYVPVDAFMNQITSITRNWQYKR